ncbi:MAG: hypothetical protein ACJAWW_001559 [Sulfurimonas sp.]|jgi:hypothetical protein
MSKTMDTSVEKTYKYLQEKYKRSVINKVEMATELNISSSTLSLYMSKGIGICCHKKLGTAKNARVIFNIYDVAIYLNTEKIETM